MIVEARGLGFTHRAGTAALSDVGFAVERGQTVGIVGESGSGKSTLVRLLCGLLPGYTGSATYAGREIGDWLREDAREFRSRNQLVFQSPSGSFDPRLRLATSLAEPLRSLARRKPEPGELETQLGEVGLSAELLSRYPHELSGGQLQRMALARALVVNPAVLYADEPTSALDVSVQAQVLNLLMDIQDRLGATLIVVSHDLAVVARLCEYVFVLRAGSVVEHGETTALLRSPASPYTRALITAAESVALDRGVSPVRGGAARRTIRGWRPHG
ncbi:hypothetical protein BAY61_14835 [Prauserella marina]|uniref:Peptide/nickel transport system ATP-binding protein n=1 Tax=Prauserella marina TaxID=530584 RepID=A0A222VQ80_9PSEU|nr:ABC transporter ATP-binding protein [Prauserella marina]ASR36067.1 hypothetical protein BAY61_14835 [Prauserella marina]PWV76794.1 ABC transporter family protein [Prauserella marina]SDC97773.1 peptide/nickel transport system ATP-binding protein [Prauserella marina]